MGIDEFIKWILKSIGFKALLSECHFGAPHLPGFSNFAGMTRRPSRISTSVTKTPQPCLFQNLAFFPAPVIHRRLFLVMTKGYRVQATSIEGQNKRLDYKRRTVEGPNTRQIRLHSVHSIPFSFPNWSWLCLAVHRHMQWQPAGDYDCGLLLSPARKEILG